MVNARKMYQVLVRGEVWTFLGNCALEQSIAKVSDGKHVGPVLPLRVASKFTSEKEPWQTVRYCVDWLGRIWYAVSGIDQPAGYLDSPCRRSCFADLTFHGANIEEIEVAHAEGEEHVEYLRTYKDEDGD